LRTGITGWKRVGTVLAAAMAASILTTACAPPATQSSSNERVVEVANICPITGPTAAPEQIGLGAMQDYVRYFNEHNGIPGVEVELLWTDNAYEVSRWISAYRRYVARGIPLFYSDDTISMKGMLAQFEKNQTPFVTGSAAPTVLFPPGWVYCPTATNGECSTAVIEYFMENWNESTPPKVVYMGENNQLGKGAAEEATPYAESLGYEVLPYIWMPFVVVDGTPQVIRLRELGADLAMLQSILPAVGPILKDADRLGIGSDVQFGGFEFSMGESLVKMVGPACDGYMVPRTTPWFTETDVPGIRKIREVQQEYHGTVREDPEYMGGWVGGAILCEALRRAIETEGCDDVDGAAVKAELDAMAGFDVDGLTRIDFTTQRRGSLSNAVYQIQDGTIVRVSNWIEVPMLVS